MANYGKICGAGDDNMMSPFDVNDDNFEGKISPDDTVRTIDDLCVAVSYMGGRGCGSKPAWIGVGVSWIQTYLKPANQSHLISDASQTFLRFT